MTTHQLFQRYPLAIDSFGTWADACRATFAKHPLGCTEFGEEWLQRWIALREWLDQPAFVEVFVEGEWRRATDETEPLRDWLEHCSTYNRPVCPRRVCLASTGEPVREWDVK